MLITPEYLKLNEKMHDDKKEYGAGGYRWAQHIVTLCEMMQTQDLLDYGCGKSTLAQNMPFDIKQYDPCVPQFASRPEPADIVICTDVLEHIEPDLIDNVLNDICNLTKKITFMSIANRPAKKHLADGRNAHLIQENDEWWLAKLAPLFVILEFSSKGEFANETNPKDMLEYLVCATPRAKR